MRTIDSGALQMLAEDAEEAGEDVTLSPGAIAALLDRITRLETQTAIRGRAVAIYQARAARAEKTEAENLAGWAEAQDGWRETELRAERAEARIKAVQDVLDRHPDPGCEEHPDGDVISCGWKSAYRDVIHALDT